MAKRELITHERLLEVLHYDPDSGVFVWKQTLSARSKAGDYAGCIDKSTGYIRIRIDDKLYHAHRLAFLYMTGRWPTNKCDHIDLEKSNNSWRNLREATHSQNLHNTKRLRSNSTGAKGVHERYGKYAATIWVNNKKLHLGVFKTCEDAHAAYCAAAKTHYGEFARTS